MTVYRIDLAYDGAGFHGYARQAGVRTVQGDLEEALHRVVPDVETVVAGRTDAGVHADGQVVSFDTDAAIDVDRLLRSLNRMLNPEIAVRACSIAPDDFNARFSAVSRTYRYRIDNGTVLDPRWRHRAWHVAWALDVDAMQRAAGHFLGEHDFASFCRAAEGRTTVRTVLSAGWRGVDDRILEFTVSASSFCHQMVRSLVAVGVEVGRGRITPDEIPEIMAARDRVAARGAAPPHGLTLLHVEYDPH